MKLLLTSAGIKNPSIHDALVDLLGKPIAESSALCIPTAAYGHPDAGPGAAWRWLTGRDPAPMCELGWKSVGVLELTALPSMGEERWRPLVQETDALLVGGGDATYLSLPKLPHSPLFDRIPQKGIWGNDHIMMWDSNSDDIAGVLLEWIEAHVEKGKRH